MINFKHCLTPDKALPLQNKVVECVTKTSTQHTIFGKVNIWRGALTEEYFSVMFIGGVVVVSVSERECHIGEKTVSYAESQSLLDTAELVKGSAPEMQQELQKHYNEVIAKKEQDEVTFADMMFILNWQYVEGAKVDESDMLGD